MNSYLTFKKWAKTVSIFTLSVLMIFSLCSCSKKPMYRISSLTQIVDEKPIVRYTYTYKGHKPLSVKSEFLLDLSQNYEDVFEYGKSGNIVGLTRTFSDLSSENFTAKKIKNQQYIFYDNKGSEFVTIIFDKSGFIVSYRYATGFVSEYAFTYDNNNAPIGFKQLEIRPSGSQLLLDFSIEFTDDETFIMKPTKENENSAEYYKAKFEKIN